MSRYVVSLFLIGGLLVGCGKASPEEVMSDEGLGYGSAVIDDVWIDICDPPPRGELDPEVMPVPDLPAEMFESSDPPPALVRLSEADLADAVAVLKADVSYSDIITAGSAVVREAEPWLGPDDVLIGVKLTIEFASPEALPVEQNAIVDVDEGAESSPAELGEDGRPLLEPANGGEWIFDAVTTAWVTIDLVEGNIFHVQATDEDFEVCAWDPAF